MASSLASQSELITTCKSPMNALEKLDYEICSYSSFSTSYYPENVLVDCPSDQTSRWSAQTNSPPQYLTLKLKRPAIVKRIKFGKFERNHVCNLKKFRVYGSLEEDRMELLLESGLKNDSKAEVFNLRCHIEDGSEHLPLLYLKIVPLLSWGPTFNFSIWYIELLGQDDPMYTCSSLKNYNQLREIEIIKLCLKHFRQQGYVAAFQALQEQTKVQLEHQLLSELHQSLVDEGNFDESEKFIEKCINDGLMDAYLSRQDYKHLWRLQQTQSTIEPGTRGGHQLVMDTIKRQVYLFGGWDGYRDLNDLWVFDIETSCWSLIFHHGEQNIFAPSPRSCHKMVFDPVSRNIFMLGRYLDNSIRTTEYIKSDFYLYDTRACAWMQISDDTSQDGGVHLIYDHQMCIDIDKRTIYVFGGKILTPRRVLDTLNESEYSGLFSYHIATNTWTQIMVDCHHPSAANEDVLSIKSRITHCMVFHSRNRKLYIYGGQRGKEDIEDFISYDVDTQSVCILNRQQNTIDMKNKPLPGYTLRATIDCNRDEIYVFSSLRKQKERRDIQQIDSSNSFWVYSLKTNRWLRIYTCRQSTEVENLFGVHDGVSPEPCPRYAHQMVYDDVAKVHYLFGGNPGKPLNSQLRLDDFWVLILEKPQREEILNHCRYLIRKQHYEEMVKTDPVKAMLYLRENVSEVIDHSDAEQLKSFHKLALLLFTTEETKTENLSKTPSIEGVSEDRLQMEELANDFTDTESSEISNSTSSSSFSKEISSINATNNPFIKRKSNLSEKCCQKSSYSVKSRRAFLFNKIVRFMPRNMVQPEKNLSDFVTI